jgi:exopolyphosphatase / guanosine-5'-triphosphate,3'-diphosphate pyrophosphatase
VQDLASGQKLPHAGAGQQETNHKFNEGQSPSTTENAENASSVRFSEAPQPTPKRGNRRRRKRKAKIPFVNPPVVQNTRTEPISDDTLPIFEPELYAALDLGTNNCRLLIATPTAPSRFRVVDSFSRIVRLGEGLTVTGSLSDAAMDRSIEALKICAEKLKLRKLKKIRLITTEACRSAKNGRLFLDRVAAETGIVLEIVDRKTEARLAVSGCAPLVNSYIDALVLFDIGGGSSEIALINRHQSRKLRLSDQIVAWTSLPIGVVSLAERFGGTNVTPQIYKAMVDDVLYMIGNFKDRHALGTLASGDRFHLLGTSGTVTTLAGLHLGLERYDRRRVDGLWMDDSDVQNMSEKLQSWSFEERVANPCIGNERADLVLAGCAILDAIRLTWPSTRLRVADRGLREGILTELMAQSGAWHRMKMEIKK